jgi:hypothetical protein
MSTGGFVDADEERRLTRIIPFWMLHDQRMCCLTLLNKLNNLPAIFKE